MSDAGPSRIIHWKPIEPMPDRDRQANGRIASVEALREEWQRVLVTFTEEERTGIRRRTLRRLAVETGIIERLYEIEWGLTLTLVAEGFTRDVVERAHGRIDDHTLETLRTQRDSLEMVLEFVRQDRKLGTAFIKELHAALTRTQATYDAHDALGRPCQVPLPHGQWKIQPNHVLRSDGSLLEYAPPEQVASEMDRLVNLYEEAETKRSHPLVTAAWLHHRFVQIHPFADGNGRVARALVLLVLAKHRYAPLVVDRHHRNEYLKALDDANEGSLRSLIRLFAQLEEAALAGELEKPEVRPVAEASTTVARTLAAQLAAHQQRREAEVTTRLHARAILVHARMEHWFESKRQELKPILGVRGGEPVVITKDSARPGDPRSYWFRRQVIESARTAGHFASLAQDQSWCSLRVTTRGVQARFVASVHHAGREASVIAVTTFGEIGTYEPPVNSDGIGVAGAPDREFVQTTKDAFRIVHTQGTEEIEARLPELEELLDEGLAVLLLRLGALI